MKTIGLATGNAGKVREIGSILAPANVRIAAPPTHWHSPAETEDTYRGNALIKAKSLAAFTGQPALADDSGIEADALDGAPGVRSARFSAEGTDAANLAKMIDAVRDGARGARYRCVAVLVTTDGRVTAVEESVEGTLITEPRGTGGFGYDPIFVPVEGDGRTMAELTPEEKDAISHRGKAFRALIPILRAL